jgi:hypothetical protein
MGRLFGQSQFMAIGRRIGQRIFSTLNDFGAI